jgi:uncharacterized protein (DUF2249 family)
MKKLILSATILFQVAFVNAQQVTNLQWAEAIGGDARVEVLSNAVDASGNVYSGGYFTGTADFDPGPLSYSLSSIAGGYDCFITKFDASGNLLWAKAFGGTLADRLYSLAVDASGNVVATGFYSGAADFDPSPLTYSLSSNGQLDAFVVKLNSSGNFVFAKNLGGAGSDQAYSIALDGSGNIYTIGTYSGTADFDPSGSTYTLASAGNLDIFISKLDASGNFVFAKSIGGTGSDVGKSITTDASGNIYTTGSYSAVADFDPSVSTYTLASAGSTDIFISKLDATGNFVFAKSIGGTGIDNGHSIAIDGLSGAILTTGRFAGSADFDPGIAINTLTTTSGSSYVYVSKLDASGNFVWAKTVQGSVNNEYSIGWSLAIDGSGIYVTGQYQGNIDFDPSAVIYTLSSAGLSDIFIWKLNSAGNFVWAKSFGDITTSDSGNSIITNGSGSIYTAGAFLGTVDFNPNAGVYNLTATTGTLVNTSTAYVLKLSQCNAVSANPVNATPPANLTICSGSSTALTATVTNAPGTYTLNWYTAPTSTNALATGLSYTTPVLSAGSYTYYASNTSTLCGISDAVPFTVTVTTCTGLDEHSIIASSIYPNPNNGLVNITLTNALSQNSTLQIYDALGKLVYEQKLSNEVNSINISHLQNGLYMYKILSNTEVVKNGKMIKQ